ncbi:type VI secretion system accessory protein TagJ [Winslowiella toletana]|nr:type VI secretion system accessory protein TagJ [Winslowiella toletana]
MHSFSQLMDGQSLAEALSAVENRIRAEPANADHRAALVQLLCLNGQWLRARAQMKSWLALKPQAQPTITLLDQCIAAEITRAAVFAGEAAPRLPGEGAEWVSDLHQALVAERQGDSARAATLRAAALDSAPLSPAQLFLQDDEQGQAVEWLTDGDGRLGPVCEMAVNGQYYWLPFALISEMQFQPPASVTDLVWRHTLVQLVDGSEQVCQIPLRYPFDEQASDAVRLAKVTEWHSDDELTFTGSGQKAWLDAEQQYPLLNLTRLVFDAAESGDE